jgi:hypothetical protein
MTLPAASPNTWISMCRGDLHVALQQHAVAAERVAGLALAALQLRDELLHRVHDAHALAAAAVRGLDH